MQVFVHGQERMFPGVMIYAMAMAVALVGCVEKSDPLTKEEQARLQEHVSHEPPDPGPDHELDVSLEGKVRLLGYSLEPVVWTAGETLRVTWFWKTEKPLDEGWQLFTHVADAEGTDRLNQDSVGVVRKLYPPGRWKKGEYVRDVQEMTLPPDWGSPRATVLVGVWNGPHRLRVAEGPTDGDNRVRAFSIRTKAASASHKPATNLPTLRAVRAEGTITLDGKLDEPAWKRAADTGDLVNTLTGAPAEPKANAKLLWDDDHLYVGFEVADDHLVSEFEDRDDHLWEQDAVEVMFDPTGDGRNYFELQVSPKGVVFDTRYDARRLPQPFGHVDWNSNVEVGVDVRGEVGNDEPDEGYTVEMAIPWKAFAAGAAPVKRPSGGDVWRANFYVMDARKQGQRAVGWSPTLTNDFHVPNRFGRVKFATDDGEVAEEESDDAPAAAKALRERLRRAEGQPEQ